MPRLAMNHQGRVLMKFSPLLFLIIGMFLTLGFSAFQAHAAQYESHQRSSATEIHHYYLTDEIENSRRAFHLFYAKGSGLQDLVERISFPIEESKVSEVWLQNAINKYHLQPQSASQHSLSQQEFYPFSQLQYFPLTPSSTPAPPSSQNPPSPSNSLDIQPTSSSLWEAQNEWNTEWEREYGRWVNLTLHPNFMVDIKLPTDCADVAYTLRWVFAYIHKLPMASRLSGSNQLFTNETMKPEWLQLPTDSDWKKDRRFRAALEFLLRNTYTHSLMKDSYPVPLNPKAFTPGIHHLELRPSSGHTMIVNKVNDPGNLPITLLFSTMPIRIRELIPTFYQAQDAPKLYKGGFYKIRWPKKTEKGWQILTAKAHPDYSEEQFHLDSNDDDEEGDDDGDELPHFIKAFKRLNPQFSFETILSKSFEELQARLKDRIQIVEEGYAFCQINDCSPGSAGDEDWSTPSRDNRLKDLHNSMNLAVRFLDQYDPEAVQRWKKILSEQTQEKSFTIGAKNYSLHQIIIALIYQLTQTDPRLSPNQRWGLSPYEGYGPTLIKTLEKSIVDRKDKVQRAEVCRQKQCKENSDNFKKLSTLILDHQLLQLWAGAQILCHISEANDCATLHHLLRSQFLEQKSYNDWYSQMPLWISNPNAPLTHRWGQQGSAFSFTLPTHQKNAAFFSQDAQWFTANKSLVKTADLSKVSFSTPEIMGQLHYASGMYFTYERQESQLHLRFYSTPQTLLSEITLNALATDPLRLWWSSPSKETLAVFSGAHFYEIDAKNGTILQSFPFHQFHQLPLDPRITIIETDQGLKMSDAQSDASQFIRFPFSIDKLSNIYIVQRTHGGWLLRTANKLYYIEKDSSILIDWDLTYSSYVFMNPSATTVLRADSEEKIKIYQRNKNSPQGSLGSSASAFTLTKIIPGIVSAATPNYFTIIQNNNEKRSAITYSLNTLAPLNLSCSLSNARSVILSDDYYYCFNATKNEFHHISGTLITVLDSNNAWALQSRSNPATTNTSDWFLTYKFIMNQVSNSFVGYTEFYALTPQSLDGPYFQANGKVSADSGFNVIDDEVVITNPQQVDIAPALLPLKLSTNLGIIKELPRVHSFLLNSVAENYPQNFVLFLP